MFSFISGSKCINHVTQTRERIVDLFSFFKSLSLSSWFAYFFTSGQINKTEFCCVFRSLEIYTQNGMRSWTFFVEFSSCDFSAFGSLSDQIHHFFFASDSNLNKSINENLAIFCFFQFQVCASSKHINYLFFIQFCHGTFYIGSYIIIFLEIEYFSDTSVYQSIALHRLLAKNSICFSWSCLSISKNCSIISIK